MNKKLIIGVIVAAIVIVAGLALYSKTHSGKFGAVTGESNLNTLGVTGLKVGANCGDSFSSSAANGCQSTTHLIAKTCNLIGTDSSQTASTTKAYDCAITGVTSSDNIIALLATSSPVGGVSSGTIGWNIAAADASTTAGFVTVLLSNLTGANAVPSANGIGSSTSVLIFQ